MNGRQLRFSLLVGVVLVVIFTFQTSQYLNDTPSVQDVNHIHQARPSLSSYGSSYIGLVNKKDGLRTTNENDDIVNSRDIAVGREYRFMCWLDPAWGRPSTNNNNNVNDTCVGRHPPMANTNATTVTCIDSNDNGQTQQPIPRQPAKWRGGMTIALLYYARPSMLIYHLEMLATYPTEIKNQITLLIVDDGSPVGLRATEYIDPSKYEEQFRLRIVRVTEDLRWNIGGARNLAFYLVDTPQVLLLDLDVVVPVETMTEVLTSPSWKTKNGTHELAHRFNRVRLNGKASKHPAVSVMDVVSYWQSGGCDEDFVGRYGFTDVHFWYRWKQDPIRLLVEHPKTFIHEFQSEDYCDPELLRKGKNYSYDTAITSSLVNTCKTTLANHTVPGKWSQNKKKMRQKVATGCWSNLFLRFPWVLEW